MSGEPPEAVLDEAERLTRLARDATGEEATDYRERREQLLAEHGYRGRFRDEDDTLVCYPDDWVGDSTVEPSRIEDTDRAVERPLSGDDREWGAVAEHNRELARKVAAEHGGVHGENATAFAEFMNNHRARRVETAGNREVEEFLEEYFPRNAWPSERQRETVEQSLCLLLRVADAEVPPVIRSE